MHEMDSKFVGELDTFNLANMWTHEFTKTTRKLTKEINPLLTISK